MKSSERLHKRLNTALRAIKERQAAIHQHFTLIIPRYHDDPLVVLCPSGHAFSTSYLDMRTLPEMIEFVNEHISCTAPEPKAGEPC